MDEESRARIREDLERQREADALEVFEENWQALEIFLACSTQWTYAGMGERVGISYPSLESVMRMMSVEDVPDTFQRVQTIEISALNAGAERCERR